MSRPYSPYSEAAAPCKPTYRNHQGKTGKPIEWGKNSNNRNTAVYYKNGERHVYTKQADGRILKEVFDEPCNNCKVRYVIATGADMMYDFDMGPLPRAFIPEFIKIDPECEGPDCETMTTWKEVPHCIVCERIHVGTDWGDRTYDMSDYAYDYESFPPVCVDPFFFPFVANGPFAVPGMELFAEAGTRDFVEVQKYRFRKLLEIAADERTRLLPNTHLFWKVGECAFYKLSDVDCPRPDVHGTLSQHFTSTMTDLIRRNIMPIGMHIKAKSRNIGNNIWQGYYSNNYDTIQNWQGVFDKNGIPAKQDPANAWAWFPMLFGTFGNEEDPNYRGSTTYVNNLEGNSYIYLGRGVAVNPYGFIMDDGTIVEIRPDNICGFRDLSQPHFVGTEIKRNPICPPKPAGSGWVLMSMLPDWRQDGIRQLAKDPNSTYELDPSGCWAKAKNTALFCPNTPPAGWQINPFLMFPEAWDTDNWEYSTNDYGCYRRPIGEPSPCWDTTPPGDDWHINPDWNNPEAWDFENYEYDMNSYGCWRRPLTDTDCPCREEVVRKQMWLTEVPQANAPWVNVQTTQVVCDTPPPTTRIDCDSYAVNDTGMNDSACSRAARGEWSYIRVPERIRIHL